LKIQGKPEYPVLADSVFTDGAPTTEIGPTSTQPMADSLGRNPLSDASYQNLGMVLNGQGSGRHPLDDASYLNLDTVLNEQGSGHRILSNALHRRPGVVKNEQGSSHLTRQMRRVRKLAEPSRLCVGT
jgi:hypothetical protein